MALASVDLVILRHGEAAPYTGSDAERPLTERGRQDTLLQMQQLASQGFQPDEIVHSPFVRTTQTASICQQVFANASISSHSGLMHSAEPDRVSYFLQESDSVLLVSHMPLVARMLQYLCPGAHIHGFGVTGYVRLEVQRDSLESRLVFDASRGLNATL